MRRQLVILAVLVCVLLSIVSSTLAHDPGPPEFRVLVNLDGDGRYSVPAEDTQFHQEIEIVTKLQDQRSPYEVVRTVELVALGENGTALVKYRNPEAPSFVKLVRVSQQFLDPASVVIQTCDGNNLPGLDEMLPGFSSFADNISLTLEPAPWCYEQPRKVILYVVPFEEGWFPVLYFEESEEYHPLINATWRAVEDDFHAFQNHSDGQWGRIFDSFGTSLDYTIEPILVQSMVEYGNYPMLLSGQIPNYVEFWVDLGDQVVTQSDDPEVSFGLFENREAVFVRSTARNLDSELVSSVYYRQSLPVHILYLNQPVGSDNCAGLKQQDFESSLELKILSELSWCFYGWDENIYPETLTPIYNPDD